MEIYNLRILLMLLIGIALFSCNSQETKKESNSPLEIGLTHAENGEYQKSIEVFQESLAQTELSKDEKAATYHAIGHVYYALSRIDSAVIYAIKAAKTFERDSYNYYISMADVALYQDNAPGGLELLEKAYAINPNEYEVNSGLGLIYLGDYGANFEDIEKAVSYNKKAYELNPNLITEDALARNYLELKNYDKAREHFKSLYNKVPDNFEIQLQLGIVEHFAGNKEMSNFYFANILTDHPEMEHVIVEFKKNNQ